MQFKRYKGLKWSAKKTVEGAKYIGEKVKSAASSIRHTTREGTGSALKTMGDSVQKFEKR
ncbi:MAG: hypothetical protein ACR5KV_06965 [Wolbachia sp.]